MLSTVAVLGESEMSPKLTLSTVVEPGGSVRKRRRLMLSTVVVLGVESDPHAFATSRDSSSKMRPWGTEADSCLQSC